MKKSHWSDWGRITPRKTDEEIEMKKTQGYLAENLLLYCIAFN